MKTTLFKSGSRGHADHGWLNSYHTFSFAEYHDPERVRFGLLRVVNDDLVSPGEGFGTHPHDNMEIVSIPLKGALAHKDSTGNEKVINTGDVQIMSAGSGLYHSEYNASKTEPVSFLQIWIFPKEKDITPRYEQKTFNPAARQNKLQTVVSPVKDDGALWINQDAWFSLANLEKGQSIDYTLNNKASGVFIFLLEGNAEAVGEKLEKRDAVGVTGTEKIEITANDNSEILVIEVPMN
ncbi:MAG: pirin family protein [Ignavibacteria bacterium]|nr:pirin family protein [Ignavibacteria bacterium]